MALITCPECGRRFSEYAAACPECACPMEIIKELLAAQSSSSDAGSAPTTAEPSSQTTRMESSQPSSTSSQGTRRLSLPAAITDRYIYVADLPSVGSEADPVLLEDRDTGARIFMKYYRGANHPDAATMRRLMQADPEHVVRTLEYHEGNDGTWEMQEYCKTGSLKDWAQTKGGRLTKSELTSMVQELTDAIHYLHHLGEGIAHRDLKPGNVLVRSEEPLDLVLADFGLSKQQALTNLTHTVKGTWYYAAPEVYAGESTAKSDWFALGAMVYEFYTGRKLFALEDGSEVAEEDARNRCLNRKYSADAVDDKRWNLLVRGLLTYSKDNRWGAEEVRAWLSGKSPKVTDASSPVSSKSGESVWYRPSWSPTLLSTPQEWLSLCLANWSRAAQSLAGRTDAKLANFLSQFDDTEKMKEIISSSASPDIKLIQLQHALYPGQDASFRGHILTLEGITEVAQAASAGDEGALSWLESAIDTHVLETYAELTGSQVASAVDWNVHEWKSQAEAEIAQLPDTQKAIGRETFRASLPELFAAALSGDVADKMRSSYASNTSSIPTSELPKEPWIAPCLKRSSGKDQPIGALVVADAVLSDAHNRKVAELEAAYQKANKLLIGDKTTEAEKAFLALGSYKDSKDKAENARERGRFLADEKQREEQYQKGEEAYTSGKYAEARAAFESLGNWKNAAAKAKDAAAKAEEKRRATDFKTAMKQFEKGNDASARTILASLGDYADAKMVVSWIDSRTKNEALKAALQQIADGSKVKEGLESLGLLSGQGGDVARYISKANEIIALESEMTKMMTATAKAEQYANAFRGVENRDFNGVAVLLSRLVPYGHSAKYRDLARSAAEKMQKVEAARGELAVLEREVANLADAKRAAEQKKALPVASEAQLAQVQSQISYLEQRLAGLGLFARAEKDSLREQISRAREAVPGLISRIKAERAALIDETEKAIVPISATIAAKQAASADKRHAIETLQSEIGDLENQLLNAKKGAKSALTVARNNETVQQNAINAKRSDFETLIRAIDARAADELSGMAERAALRLTKEAIDTRLAGIRFETRFPDAAMEGNHLVFTFGSWGGEPIKWRVLGILSDRVFAITDSVIDCVKYNTSYIDVTWETCSLRRWLNGVFFKDAFSSDERRLIKTVRLDNPGNPSYRTYGGNPTQDSIFCLSIAEAKKYFKGDADRAAKPTSFARKNNAYVWNQNRCADWWLRSPGHSSSYAASVSSVGSVDGVGQSASRDSAGVRPALYINLES